MTFLEARDQTVRAFFVVLFIDKTEIAQLCNEHICTKVH